MSFNCLDVSFFSFLTSLRKCKWLHPKCQCWAAMMEGGLTSLQRPCLYQTVIRLILIRGIFASAPSSSAPTHQRDHPPAQAARRREPWQLKMGNCHPPSACSVAVLPPSRKKKNHLRALFWRQLRPRRCGGHPVIRRSGVWSSTPCDLSAEMTSGWDSETQIVPDATPPGFECFVCLVRRMYLLSLQCDCWWK